MATDYKKISRSEYEFPYSLVVKAYRILEEKGHAAFREYANRVKMPASDIEACLEKYGYNHYPEIKKEWDERFRQLRAILNKWGAI